MFERILPGEKGYVAMQTNFGKLNIELFCDKVILGTNLWKAIIDVVHAGTENML